AGALENFIKQSQIEIIELQHTVDEIKHRILGITLIPSKGSWVCLDMRFSSLSNLETIVFFFPLEECLELS
ncbi:hypothetical protein Tco_1039834, partial [Tanacetum coccineum]